MQWTDLLPALGVSIANAGFVVWGAFIKDPPLFISWREHKTTVEQNGQLLEQNGKLVDQNGQLLGLVKTRR